MAARSHFFKFSMKRILPIFLLLLAPHLVLAQTQNKSQQASKRQEQIISLIAPYLQADTFQGKFDFTMSNIQNSKEIPFYEAKMQTSYRLDGDGNKIRDLTRISIKYKINSHPVNFTFKSVDNGKNQTGIIIERGLYSQVTRDQYVAPIALLLPFLSGVSRMAERDTAATFAITKATQNGCAVNILSSQGKRYDYQIRAVTDAQTDELQSLRLVDKSHAITVRVSDQVFDAPLSDALFQWRPPANFRRISQRELESLLFPPALAAPSPTPTSTPTPPKN